MATFAAHSLLACIVLFSYSCLNHALYIYIYIYIYRHTLFYFFVYAINVLPQDLRHAPLNQTTNIALIFPSLLSYSSCLFMKEIR